MRKNIARYHFDFPAALGWRRALAPIWALTFLALALPGLIWTILFLLPPSLPPSLRELAAGSKPQTSLLGDPSKKKTNPLILSPAGLRYQGLGLEAFFHSTEPVKVGAKFDFQTIVPWTAARTRSHRGPAPVTIDNFLYHSDSPLGVSLHSGRFLEREKLSIDQNRSLRAYFGILHGHTSSSDGRGTVAEAFATARDLARLDFFATTDHSEAWRIKGGPGDKPWQEVKDEAQRASRDGFVGMAGFEYSSSAFGHFTVLGTKTYRDSVLDFSLRDFYDWLADPQQSNGIVFFNHPGFHSYRRPFEFSHFDFEPRLAQIIVGMEVLHRNSAYRYLEGYGREMPYFDEGLLKGWELGAVGGQDNHRASWGLQDAVRIAPLMKRLTEEDLVDALRNRRFYATQVQDLQFIVEARGYQSPWYPMGSHLKREEIGSKPVQVRVAFADPTGTLVPRRLEIVSAGQLIGTFEFDAASVQQMRPPARSAAPPSPRAAAGQSLSGEVAFGDVDPTTLRGFEAAPELFPRAGEWRFELNRNSSGEGGYFYVRFYQGDDADEYTQSSPIWFE